ncbi:hypothetical protein DY000_02057968 [Brassica cretica]|uniref:Uncharacterized protein n=1 Tax=Brassica cretica TaxID=69181 RepID=A0ABQ7AHX1_BRACR|nr:hypothetical protein DY000_02057968 [Brassica cretica]
MYGSRCVFPLFWVSNRSFLVPGDGASSDPSAPTYDSRGGDSLCSVLPAFVYIHVIFYPMKTKLFGVNLLSSIDSLVLQMRSQPKLIDALRLKWLRR